jgi:hypothetical protein
MMAWLIVFGWIFLLEDFSTFTISDWLWFVGSIAYVAHHFSPTEIKARKWSQYKNGS